MNFISANQVMNRLNEMLDRAINGEVVETTFDETKMSALETKLSAFLAMNQRQKEELQQEKERISELVSDISHQTKTPITNILLYSQLLKESCEQEEVVGKQQLNCANALVAQAEKLDFLIKSLMKTSRLEAGIIKIEEGQQSVHDLLDLSIEQILPKANEKKIRVYFCGEEKTCEAVELNQTKISEADCKKTYVSCDLKWTSEAIFNVLDNAVKYSGERTKIKISITSYQMFCRIDIIDEGIGIAEDEKEKVFQRFYRSEQVHNQEGVGLGLYLAREIINRQGGYMKVQNGAECGSVFSIFLPMKQGNLSEL